MYTFINGVSRFLSLFSPRALERLAHFSAFLVFSVFRWRRNLMLKNIATAFGDTITPEGREHIAYHSIYHFALTILEFLAERRGQLGEQVEIEGRAHLDQALAEGKGVYILCIHMGSWEAMGGAITRKVKPAHVIVKKVGSEDLNRFVLEQRQRNGFYSITRKQKGDALRAIQSILTKGEIVGFVMDQARPGEPLLPFFNKPAKTNTSLAAIWRRNRAPIIPAYITRVAAGKHIIKVKPALELQVSENTEKDVLEHSRYFNKVVESMVRECPEQYFWIHNRWKAR